MIFITQSNELFLQLLPLLALGSVFGIVIGWTIINGLCRIVEYWDEK